MCASHRQTHVHALASVALHLHVLSEHTHAHARVQLLLPDGRKPHKALVFCNSVDSCRAVEHHCREAGLPTLCYHGDMPVAARQESMAAFAGACALVGWAVGWVC